MQKKIFLVLLIFCLNLTFVSSANTCFFEDLSCQRFNSEFITLNLNIVEGSDSVKTIEGEIYQKSNPLNKIKVDIQKISTSQFQIKNKIPFTQADVYVLEIKFTSLANSYKIEKFEFIFDNLEPLPPFIETNIQSSSTSIQIQGKTNSPNLEIIAENTNLNQNFQSSSNSNSIFNLDLTLQNGINIVNFYTKKGNLNSQKLQRIITVSSDTTSNYANSFQVQNLATSSINWNTNFNQDTYYTFKRNFLVLGSSDGYVYINGVKSKFSNSQFAQIIILNEGLNKIEIKSKNKIDYLNIYYMPPKFKFLNLDYKKVIFSPSLNFQGNTNLNLNFKVYLNGRFIEEVTPQNNQFSANLNSLKPGKNYIFLKGPFGAIYQDVIYYETQSPKIEILTESNLVNPKNFYFQISSEYGIDKNSLQVLISSPSNEFSYSKDQILFKNDIYYIDISNLEDGEYNLKISAKSLSGQYFEKTSSININPSHTIIKSISFSDFTSYSLGNKLFVDTKSPIDFKLEMSKNIAFNRVFLNGIELVNYKIQKDNSVYFYNVEFKNNSGKLKFNFVDKDDINRIYTQEYTYYTNLEKPKLKIDYITSNKLNSENIIKIYGSINDSKFNKTSLRFSPNSNVNWFGNNFEAYLKATDTPELFGVDYLNTELERINLNTYFTQLPQILIEKDALQNKTSISLTTSSKIKLYSYDGFNFENLAYHKKINLPLADREGIRSLNLKYSQDMEKKTFLDSFKVDNIKPYAYLLNTNSGYELIIDGTLSNINLDSIELSINQEPITTISYCETKISNFNTCIDLNFISNSDSISLFVKDEAGNNLTTTFSASNSIDEILKDNLNFQIYLNGNDFNVFDRETFIQGTTLSDYPLTKLTIDKKNCKFDDYNFICYANLNIGENSFLLEAENSYGEKTSKIVNITRLTKIKNNYLTLLNLSGENFYRLDNQNYILDENLDITYNSSEQLYLSVFIDNREILIGKSNIGENIFSLNISQDIQSKPSDEFDIYLKGVDEFGIETFSNKLHLIYNSILDTIIEVIIK